MLSQAKGQMEANSNTTLVKVKFISGAYPEKWLANSNTTLVKVKLKESVINGLLGGAFKYNTC